jgi:hypothetical protein
MVITISGLTENQKKVLRRALMNEQSDTGLALHTEGIDAEERATLEQDLVDAMVLYQNEGLM